MKVTYFIIECIVYEHEQLHDLKFILAIAILKDKPTGTFLIRDSNNFPGAYGLALKVDKPPPNVQIKRGTDPSNELVRHFLIEPTTKGVRIKGCCNEPIFGK